MKKFSRAIFWIAIGAVSILSLLPSDQLLPTIFDWWDKAQHALAFLVLGSIGLWAYPSCPVRLSLVSV
jgi:hypothetical protein